MSFNFNKVHFISKIFYLDFVHRGKKETKFNSDNSIDVAFKNMEQFYKKLIFYNLNITFNKTIYFCYIYMQVISSVFKSIFQT